MSIGLLGMGATFAQSINVSFAPYVTYINYSGSKVKKNGVAATAVATISLEKGLDIFSLGYGYTHLNYKANYGSWNQNDYTVSYTTYRLYPWFFGAGFHYIATPNNDFSQKGKIGFLTVGYTQRYKWDLSLFTSYSDYKQGVAAFEIRPSYGVYSWSDYYSGIYFSVDGTYINVKGTKTLETSKRNYVSAGASITFFKIGSYSVKLSGWGGQRLLMVDDAGFVVYNLRERYKYGGSLQATYYIAKNLSVSGIFGYNRYKEIETGSNVDVTTFTVSVSYSF